MKLTIASMLLVIVLLLGLYPMSGIVTEVDKAANLVTVQLWNGYTYQFCGTEDWLEGDIAAMIMFDRLTPIITDDMIISVRYVGYIE